VGTESPTFIEPVQKRKDGIEAMFMRQSKAQKSEPDPPSSSVTIASPPARSGKRKRERSPGKPEAVDVDASEANSDVEILSGPIQSVRPSPSLAYARAAVVYVFYLRASCQSSTSPSKVKKEEGDTSLSSSQPPQVSRVTPHHCP
jgi:hypothetical protein